MDKKLYKFTFKAQPKRMWNNYQFIDIKYKSVEIGYISNMDRANWTIFIQIPATQKEIEKNPNCPWQWLKIKQVFNTSIEAKNWLNDNRKSLIDTLYYKYIENEEGAPMKANIKGKMPIPQTLDEAAQAIHQIYSEKLKYEIPRAIILGGFTVYEILADNYISKIDKATTDIEKETAIANLIEKIRKEDENVKKQKADAHSIINAEKEVPNDEKQKQ